MAKYIVETTNGKYEVEVADEGPQPKSLLGKVNDTALGAVQGVLETVAAPVEVAGEIIRGAVENPRSPLDDFRAPSIVQRFAPSTRTTERPAFGVDTANKLLRATAGAADAFVRGDNVMEGARRSYNADRGILGAVEDTAGSLLMGRLAPNAMSAPNEVTSKIASSVAKGSKTFAKGAAKVGIRAGFGPNATEQALLFNRPNEVKNAKDISDLADDFANKITDLSGKVSELDGKAWDSLLKLKSEPASRLIKALKSVKADFTGTGKTKIGDADKKAIAQIDRYIDRISEIKQPGVKKGLEQMLDQRQLRNIVQSIRNDTRFDLPDADPVNRAVQAAQGKIDDILKENGNYAQVMKELAPATKTLKEAIVSFNLRKEVGAGFVPKDSTPQKLSSALGKNKVATKKLLEKVKEYTGTDYADEINLTRAKESFTPGIKKSEGSRRTLAGTVLGTALEPIIPGFGLGPTLGGGLGFLSDYYGGAVAGKGIDAARIASTKVGKLLATLKSRTPQNTGVGSLIEQIKRNPALIRALNLDSSYQQ